MAENKVILSIDDERFVRHSFRVFLEDIGFDVVEAENGKIGIEQCRRLKIDLVLLDLNMPKMNGLEVLDILVEESPGLPVIVVSGVGVFDDVIEAIRCGAWDYILKPIQDYAILKYAINRALEKADLLIQNKKYQENLKEMVEERTQELEEANVILTSEIESRKIAEGNLQESRKMLQSILETVPDIIYRLDENGNINFISKAVQNYGLSPNEFINKPINEFVHPKDYEKSYWHLRTRRCGDRKTKNFEVRLFQKNSYENYPLFMLEAEGMYSSYNGNNFLGTQGVVRDISLRKEAENEVKKSLLEKKSLLREVHHRVKNNMQVILSLLNLQMRDIKNEEIQTILKESQNRILSMAIVHESIYKTDNFAQINMKDFIKNLYYQIAKSYNIDLKIKVGFTLEDLFVSLDSSVPLAIILNEVFTNIFKHAFEQKNNAKISVVLKKINDSRATVSVEDNGVGIPDEIDPHNPKSMGLSLIKTLTRQLGGELSVEAMSRGTKTTVGFATNIVQFSF